MASEVAKVDALSQFMQELDELVARTRKRMAENPQPCGSRALAFAVQAGLPPRMAYTVAETAKYTGLDVKTLYQERDAGRIHFVLPNGNSKGNRITVDEVDRWMREN